MRSALDSRLKTRVILGFKYHLLTLNSQKMIRKKLDRMLLVKSINAIKYFNMSQSISKSYAIFRDAKIRKSMFENWRARYTTLCT